MAADPQDPDTFDEPAGGTVPAGAEGTSATPADTDDETPEADAAEQRTEVERDEDDVPPSERHSDEVNPADAAEQARVVEQGEDEYR